MHRIFEFLLFGLAPLLFGMVALPEASFAEAETLSGEVVYRERIALPPNARLTVELADVSLAAIVAEATVNPAGQAPIGFRLAFDSSVIRPNVPYVLQARITVDDRLMFTTVERHEVDPLGAGSPTVVVKMVAP